MEDWKSYLTDTEIIVHAGGLSERWYPVTQGQIPKPVTTIGSKPRPVIDWVLLPYVKSGVRKFFITLWHNPEAIINHCEKIKENTGIDFVYLLEEEKRMGKAGVVKHYLQKGILDPSKHKLNLNSSDIVKYNIENFVKFHLEGLSKGSLTTILGSRTGSTQFDKLVYDAATGQVVRLESKPIINLLEGEVANVGTVYFDSKVNELFLRLSDEELPVDWEKCSISDEIFKSARCFSGVEIVKSWIALKASHDHSKFKNVDFENWFGVNSVEEYLG